MEAGNEVEGSTKEDKGVGVGIEVGIGVEIEGGLGIEAGLEIEAW